MALRSTMLYIAILLFLCFDSATSFGYFTKEEPNQSGQRIIKIKSKSDNHLTRFLMNIHEIATPTPIMARNQGKRRRHRYHSGLHLYETALKI